MIENKDKEIKRLNGVYNNLLEDSGVALINGRAKLLDAHTVEVAGKKYSAERVLITVGGKANTPDVTGAEHIITSKP